MAKYDWYPEDPTDDPVEPATNNVTVKIEQISSLKNTIQYLNNQIGVADLTDDELELMQEAVNDYDDYEIDFDGVFMKYIPDIKEEIEAAEENNADNVENAATEIPSQSNVANALIVGVNENSINDVNRESAIGSSFQSIDENSASSNVENGRYLPSSINIRQPMANTTNFQGMVDNVSMNLRSDTPLLRGEGAGCSYQVNATNNKQPEQSMGKGVDLVAGSMDVTVNVSYLNFLYLNYHS